jgi:hypothetical protein
MDRSIVVRLLALAVALAAPHSEGGGSKKVGASELQLLGA